MGYLYVTESSAKVTFEENSFYVKKKDNSTTRIPAETLESISFFGNPQMTTQCMQQCMKRGIPVSFYSKGGQYFRRLFFFNNNGRDFTSEKGLCINYL